MSQIDPSFTLHEKIENLKNQLLSANPHFSSVLSEIHSLTKQNPTFVYGLSDEEIATIIAGYGKYTNITIESSTKKKKTNFSEMDENSV